MSDSSSPIEKKIIYRRYVLKNDSENSSSVLGPGIFSTTDTDSFDYDPVDYIIGFASEDYNPNGGGTGNFHLTGDPATLSPETWKTQKESYPNSRVVISIGGDMGTDYPFNPDGKHVWVATAIKSIKEIIHVYDDDDYKNLIDGIDIHYGAIKSSADDFSYCIGKVIKSLKTDPDLTIKVVSIAPGEYTQSYYQKLYYENQNYIDLVDYLFTDRAFITDDIVNFYKKLVADYSHAAVIPGCLFDDKHEDAVINLVRLNFAPGYFNY